MPLPTSGTLSLSLDSSKSKPAYLVKFPEQAWDQLQEAVRSGSKLSMSMDGIITLHIGEHEEIPLEAQNGTSTEIHRLSSSLSMIAVASTRLNVPMSSVSTARAADRLRAQNEAFDKERKERAERVNGVAPKHRAVASVAVPMGRTQSSPATTPASAATAQVPQVPLKTRVVQLLALGSMGQDDIVKRVGGAEQDVMRVVKVVGRSTSPRIYSLQPSQYSKVKIASWKYTYGEQQEVIRLAREAFDELGLPSDAEERAELDKKEQEALMGGSSSGSSSSDKAPTAAVPEPKSPELALSSLMPQSPSTAPTPRTASPPPLNRPTSSKKSSASKGKSAIAKEMAKFRAEAKRAGSLPNVNREEGLASPRAATVAETKTPSSPVESLADKLKERQERIRREARRTKAESEKSEEERGRPREPVKREAYPVKEKPRNDKRKRDEFKGENDLSMKKKSARDYSSSDEALVDERPKIPSFKRKSRPPSLDLEPTSRSPPDPEAMRDRYEELFPAYQLLTRRLVNLHSAAEGIQLGDAEAEVVSKEEVGKMVNKWERWHTELAGIRRWFGEA